MAATKQKISIGTRGSRLALVQAELARAALEKIAPEAEIETKIFVTQGDKKLAWSLEKTGGKGLFTSELEAALVAGEIDVAVHSGKDLPTALAAGTALAGCLTRADTRDVFVCRENFFDGDGFENAFRSVVPAEKKSVVPAGATVVPEVKILSRAALKIATGSPRRRAQARALFPNAEFCGLRGNLHTRLQKIADGATADATFLAAAGLARLGISSFPGLKFFPLSVGAMVPAAAQAAIALQTRAGDADFFSSACDAATSAAVTLERAFLAALGEGCHTAFAVYFDGEVIRFFREDIGARVCGVDDDFSAALRAASAETAPDGNALGSVVARVLRRIFGN